MSKRIVTKVFAKKKPSELKMVTKIVPAKRNSENFDIESMVKISFACGLCNEEFSSRDLYEEHQDQFHSVPDECVDNSNHETENTNEFQDEFDEDQFIMLDDEESDHIENELVIDPCELNEENSIVTIKQEEDEEIFENVETLEEDFILSDDVTDDYHNYQPKEEDTGDEFEIIYLDAEEDNEIDDDEEEEEEKEDQQEKGNNRRVKGQPRLFKAENDPHRYILETSKTYYNNGKKRKNPLKYTKAEVEGRNLPCPQCNKKFPDGSRLNRHLATHKTERPYKCFVEGCNKDYKTPHHLKTHFYTHTMDVNRTAPYVCDYPNCYKCFGFACDLKNHKLSHEMKTNPILKKFQCTVCLKRFAKTNHLKKHSLLHLPDDEINWLYCTEGCGKRFRHTDNLNQHLATHGYEKYQYSKRRKMKQNEQLLMEISN